LVVFSFRKVSHWLYQLLNSSVNNCSVVLVNIVIIFLSSLLASSFGLVVK